MGTRDFVQEEAGFVKVRDPTLFNLTPIPYSHRFSAPQQVNYCRRARVSQLLAATIRREKASRGEFILALHPLDIVVNKYGIRLLLLICGEGQL